MLHFCLVTQLLLCIGAELHLNRALDLVMLVPQRHHRPIDSVRNRRCIAVPILHLGLLTQQFAIRFLVARRVLLLELGQALRALRAPAALFHPELLDLLPSLLLRATLASLVAQHRRRDVMTLLLQIPILQ